jgi:hypothetical protein
MSQPYENINSLLIVAHRSTFALHLPHNQLLASDKTTEFCPGKKITGQKDNIALTKKCLVATTS